MADILLDTESAPGTPAAGQIVCFGDSSNKQWAQKNDAGIYQGDLNTAAVATIGSHSADTYYKGIQLPSFSMQPGMTWEWVFPVSKSAGVAAPAYTIRIGAAQTIADTAVLTINGPAQTAVVDQGIVRIIVVCRSVSGAGVLQGAVWLQHNLQITGLANTPAGMAINEGTSAGFANNALGGQFIGLSVNPGASAAWVVNLVSLKCWY